MTEQITPDKFPSNGGWRYRQPQFGNWTNKMAMVGFDASVKEIQRARTQNKALSMQHNLSTDYDAIANELIAYNEKIRGIVRPISFFQASRSRASSGAPNAAANVNWFRQITRSGVGVATLADWLGTDGTPVDATLAESRASTCSGNGFLDGSRCPLNKEGDLLAFFTKPLSDLLRRQLEERKQLKLSTNQDEKLGVCYACGCPLKLKVHVPIKFIKAHMQEPEIGMLDPRCWILKEQ